MPMIGVISGATTFAPIKVASLPMIKANAGDQLRDAEQYVVRRRRLRADLDVAEHDGVPLGRDRGEVEHRLHPRLGPRLRPRPPR